jgi:site-specific DNA-methyltransferase (adenine-specific)
MYGKLSQIKSDAANLTSKEKTLSGQRGYPKSIIEQMRPNNLTGGGLHPTQKPVGLFEYLIRTYTNEGELVFDGFGGSGTTALAAHRCNRNFIVIEV